MSKMAGTKRQADSTGSIRASKKFKADKPARSSDSQADQSKSKLKKHSSKPVGNEDEFQDLDDEAGSYGEGGMQVDSEDQKPPRVKLLEQRNKGGQNGDGSEGFLNGTSSREAHAKQKALKQERRSARPNADPIYRSKKIWERLRRKSHVPKEERTVLVEELFSIITGQVKDFVFKHDSVRVIQCALKYATPAQKKLIANELRGSYRELAESKYAKFLVAKLVMLGDDVRDMVVPEFFGHVKRLMRHPEASWIVDDIYRGLATKQQKALLLREWYGTEFVVFRNGGQQKNAEDSTAELSEILNANPEKRGPIMQHLKEMTNQLVQKKTTGFTMLHDALLQYALNVKPESPEATEFWEMLKDDEEGDCFKNLAFTKSGSRLVCLALAYGNSKDRRTILKFFKTHIKTLAGDVNGNHVLLTAYEVIDDTVMSAKAIFPELLNKDLGSDERAEELLHQCQHLTARVPLLYLMARDPPKWLVTEEETKTMAEVRAIRATTSKKDPESRRIELVKAISQPLIDLIATQADTLAQSSFGCQFISEVITGSIGEKEAAKNAVANLADAPAEVRDTAHVGRMLKRLAQGGTFDTATKTIFPSDPPLGFGPVLYQQITATEKKNILQWASGSNSFVVLAMLESPDFGPRDELVKYLTEHASELDAENPGARMISEKLGTKVKKAPTDKKENKKKEKGIAMRNKS